MALSQYLTQTQLLLHDNSGTLYNQASVTGYINIARSQLALDAECVRFLYGVDGLYLTGTFAAGSPIVTAVVGLPSSVLTGNQQTVVSPNVVAGSTIASFDAGAATITLNQNATVSQVGATFQVTPSFNNNTGVNQEFYPLPQSLSPLTGVRAAIGVKSVSVNWGQGGGSQQPMLRYWAFSVYQAYFRYYGQTGLQGQPCVWTRYQNNILIRPVASSVYPMQWDCICSVVDLVDDSTVEAIPYPFTDAVPYYAAYMALLNGQRAGDAQAMLDQYTLFANRARAFWMRTMQGSPYLYGS